MQDRARDMTAHLKRLRADLSSGLVAALIVNQTRAELFDNFLDLARQYLGDGQKDPAGVIAGVVFEDSVRRICASRGLGTPGAKLDVLISDLASAKAITQALAKRCRAAADVRTRATHADWTQFGADDVRATIAVTDELVLSHLA